METWNKFHNRFRNCSIWCVAWKKHTEVFVLPPVFGVSAAPHSSPRVAPHTNKNPQVVWPKVQTVDCQYFSFFTLSKLLLQALLDGSLNENPTDSQMFHLVSPIPGVEQSTVTVESQAEKKSPWPKRLSDSQRKKRRKKKVVSVLILKVCKNFQSWCGDAVNELGLEREGEEIGGRVGRRGAVCPCCWWNVDCVCWSSPVASAHARTHTDK